MKLSARENCAGASSRAIATSKGFADKKRKAPDKGAEFGRVLGVDAPFAGLGGGGCRRNSRECVRYWQTSTR